MITTRTRTARKPHTCNRCRTRIPAGARYQVHIASPGHDDLANTGWWRLAECAACATVCGRPLPVQVDVTVEVGA